jgi:GNAT superfamily N-acetyltransferase
MQIKKTQLLTEDQKKQINVLWNSEYPESVKHADVSDFDNYLEKLGHPSHTLLIDESNTILGWFAHFDRDHEKWFAMIISSTIQGQGYGSTLLRLAKENQPELNGWVIDDNKYLKANGELYKSPLAFYIKNGFQVLKENRLELETFSAIKIKWKK